MPTTQEKLEYISMGFGHGKWGASNHDGTYRCLLCPSKPTIKDNVPTVFRHILSDTHLDLCPKDVRQILATVRFDYSNLQCHHCGKWFSRSDALVRHLRERAHRDKAPAPPVVVEGLAYVYADGPSANEPVTDAKAKATSLLLPVHNFDGLVGEPLTQKFVSYLLDLEIVAAHLTEQAGQSDK